MKAGFDTSVLVAALVAAHPRHPRAVIWLEAAATSRIEGVASWHAVAETYAVLTRLPLLPRLSTEQAEEVVLRLAKILSLLPPTAAVYRSALRRAHEKRIRSGGLFDALQLITAERAGADLFLTFNVDDFSRIEAPTSPRIVAPPDPPALKV